jgi:hypothetical protein
MDELMRKIMEAAEAMTADNEQERLKLAIKLGDLPAGATIDSLTPEQKVWFLGRDPVEVGLPEDFGSVEHYSEQQLAAYRKEQG